MKLDQNLKDLCHLRGISIKTLARRSRVKEETLLRWLKNEPVCNLNEIKRVASVLKVSLHQLVFDTPDPYANGVYEIFKENLREGFCEAIDEFLKAKKRQRVRN